MYLENGVILFTSKMIKHYVPRKLSYIVYLEKICRQKCEEWKMFEQVKTCFTQYVGGKVSLKKC